MCLPPGAIYTWLGCTISPVAASFTVSLHSSLSRSENSLENMGGICCTITIPGSGGRRLVSTTDKASVPPVEAPIAIRFIFPELPAGMLITGSGGGVAVREAVGGAVLDGVGDEGETGGGGVAIGLVGEGLVIVDSMGFRVSPFPVDGLLSVELVAGILPLSSSNRLLIRLSKNSSVLCPIVGFFRYTAAPNIFAALCPVDIP